MNIIRHLWNTPQKEKEEEQVWECVLKMCEWFSSFIKEARWIFFKSITSEFSIISFHNLLLFLFLFYLIVLVWNVLFDRPESRICISVRTEQRWYSLVFFMTLSQHLVHHWLWTAGCATIRRFLSSDNDALRSHPVYQALRLNTTVWGHECEKEGDALENSNMVFNSFKVQQHLRERSNRRWKLRK